MRVVPGKQAGQGGKHASCGLQAALQDCSSFISVSPSVSNKQCQSGAGSYTTDNLMPPGSGGGNVPVNKLALDSVVKLLQRRAWTLGTGLKGLGCRGILQEKGEERQVGKGGAWIRPSAFIPFFMASVAPDWSAYHSAP